MRRMNEFLTMAANNMYREICWTHRMQDEWEEVKLVTALARGDYAQAHRLRFD